VADGQEGLGGVAAQAESELVGHDGDGGEGGEAAKGLEEVDDGGDAAMLDGDRAALLGDDDDGTQACQRCACGWWLDVVGRGCKKGNVSWKRRKSSGSARSGAQSWQGRVSNLYSNFGRCRTSANVLSPNERNDH
jgi:hypothetical protein